MLTGVRLNTRAVLTAATGVLLATSAWTSSLRALAVPQADVEVIESREPLLDGPARWRIGPDPIVAIGSRDGEGGVGLFRITDAVRLSDGRIVAWSAGDQELLYFDGTGRLLERAGGEGGGPGEFRAGYGLTRLPGDSVSAYDLVQERVTYFDGTGDMVRVTSLRSAGPLRSALYLGRLPDGSHILREGVNPMYGTGNPGLRRTQGWLTRVSADGTSSKRVLAFEGDETLVTSRGAGSPPFGRASITVLAGERLITGFGGRWELRFRPGAFGRAGQRLGTAAPPGEYRRYANVERLQLRGPSAH